MLKDLVKAYRKFIIKKFTKKLIIIRKEKKRGY